ncbi:2-isopropylmalate synthase [Bremerella volcania]|uniref:Citramalate synthase n=1 Tax=Bremerella volcania TaxID=2527984 RepID=A0A518C9W9_9BACT|nr:citramalate synthase [Bremerella volcania]QDU76012.1 2-isopropylmalate synthase [Bremerella volcania]
MKKIEIYDTTLRDGAQGEGVSFSLQDKLAITERLDEIGVDFIEGGYPLSNEKDAEYFRRVQEMDLKQIKVCAFGMTRRKGMLAKDDPGMQALVNSGAPVLTIVGKTHDFHVTDVLRVTLEENLAMIADSVELMVTEGREVIYDAEHFFDGWKANPEYAAQTIQSAAKAGARMVVLCDTNGGSLPEEIAELTKAAIDALSEFNVPVGIHTHNDGDLAVANALAAVDAGALQIQGTINGFGERCGNADLISCVANLALKKEGYEVLGGDGFEHLTELSRFVYDTANVNRRNNQAFVGQSAFAHKGGMHVHAVNRAASSYEHISPEAVGNERRVLVSELSGRSNIMALTTKMNIEQDREVMDKILASVVELENRGFQFEAAEASFELLVRKTLGTFNPHFKTLKYHVEVEDVVHYQDLELTTEATVKLDVANAIKHEVGEGDGPIDALSAALRKALLETYPNLNQLKLVDYKVRVVNSEAGTAARTRVQIECSDEHDVWGTIGVSENIIQASWNALVDAVEYKLHKDEAASQTPAKSQIVATN